MWLLKFVVDKLVCKLFSPWLDWLRVDCSANCPVSSQTSVTGLWLSVDKLTVSKFMQFMDGSICGLQYDSQTVKFSKSQLQWISVPNFLSHLEWTYVQLRSPQDDQNENWLTMIWFVCKSFNNRFDYLLVTLTLMLRGWPKNSIYQLCLPTST